MLESCNFPKKKKKKQNWELRQRETGFERKKNNK